MNESNLINKNEIYSFFFFSSCKENNIFSFPFTNIFYKKKMEQNFLEASIDDNNSNKNDNIDNNNKIEDISILKFNNKKIGLIETTFFKKSKSENILYLLIILFFIHFQRFYLLFLLLGY